MLRGLKITSVFSGLLALVSTSAVADDPPDATKPPTVVAGARVETILPRPAPTPARQAILEDDIDPYAVPDPRTIVLRGPVTHDAAGNTIRRIDLRDYLGDMNWPTPVPPEQLLAIEPRFRYLYTPWESPWVLEQKLRILHQDERDQQARAFNQADMARRTSRLLSYHDKALQQGLDLLHEGEYQKAVVKLTMASKLNEGDPASRIHLAQARLALGHYAEAAAVLRRALQLQPKLVYADLELDSYFPEPGTLSKFTDQLGDWMRNATPTSEIEFLLGFFEFQRDHIESANRAFQRAALGLKKDNLTRDLLEITRPPLKTAGR